MKSPGGGEGGYRLRAEGLIGWVGGAVTVGVRGIDPQDKPRFYGL